MQIERKKMEKRFDKAWKKECKRPLHKKLKRILKSEYNDHDKSLYKAAKKLVANTDISYQEIYTTLTKACVKKHGWL